ncbi:uncharacterized protein PSFLO_00829 [Pseudozyma flocculosa]|uniref:Uncharacterized protein n=1 Tax=Pseudozyma flocculosa TaxID=84751 RepID=A0A5C3ESW8_9BASI|nr:uncharacterized protein PSFLO_00829 [Pseudozyma flocculosa]
MTLRLCRISTARSALIMAASDVSRLTPIVALIVHGRRQVTLCAFCFDSEPEGTRQQATIRGSSRAQRLRVTSIARSGCQNIDPASQPASQTPVPFSLPLARAEALAKGKDAGIKTCIWRRQPAPPPDD